jgi:hypothetical protein
MRNLILLAFMMLSFAMLGQKNIKIKKKYLGNYAGVIPAYQVQSDQGVLNVDETTISIVFGKDETVVIQIGNEKKESTYLVLEKDKKDYSIEIRTKGEEYIEKLKLKGKDKTVIREGLYPQPKSKLKKD